MNTYCDNKEKYAYYDYDDAGQRTYKMTFNASYMANNHYGYPTLEVERMAFYPNGFMNINHYGEYTKHYYAENQRIASKIGTGSILGANLCNDLDSRYNVAPQDLSNLQSMVEGKAQKDLTFVTIPENMGTPQWVDMDYLDYNICNLQGDRYQNEDILFFYHGNHLSSTQMITDMDGNIVQQVHYAPFGEIISEYNAYWHGNLTPNYTFNAKELDEESGMYYFEARYLKPPSFISRDPLFEKYPWISPYAYCANNPVIMIDPDGKDWFENELTGEVFYNSQMGKNDVGAGNMTGDGWKWMGANDMFGEVNDEFIDKNLNFLFSNGAQLSRYQSITPEGTQNVDEMKFGGNSQAFMSSMGYKNVVSQAFVYDKSTTETLFKASYTTGERISIAEKSTYVPKNYGIINEKRDYLRDTKGYMTETGWGGNINVYKSQYTYGQNGKSSMYDVFDGRSHKSFGSWNEYKGNNTIINSYRPKK